jgi:hypothetical protein
VSRGPDQRLPAYHDAAPTGHWTVMVMSLRPSTQPLETPTSISPAPAGPLSGRTVVVDPLEESRALWATDNSAYTDSARIRAHDHIGSTMRPLSREASRHGAPSD